MTDTLITGGTVIDPEGRTERLADVAIRSGRIDAIEERIDPRTARQVVDASGQYVVPGLVDLHSHINWRTTPHAVNAETLAPSTGVTAWIDAGSAYPTTIEALREHVVDRVAVHVRSFLRIGRGAAPLTPPSGIEERDADLLAEVAKRHRDLVVGVKVSMGQCEMTPLKVARRAADLAGLPLMVHIAQQPPPVADVLAMLRPDDIVTHAFTGQSMRLADDDGRLLPATEDAIRRGVRFDVGHGAGSFSWSVAEQLVRHDLWPHTISTDSWQISVRGPMFDMPTCLSKFMHLGMSLMDVVRAAAVAPASAVGGLGAIGHLRVGDPADLAILRILEGSFPLYDTTGDVRDVNRLIVATATFLGGVQLSHRPLEPLADWIDLALSRDGFDPNPQGGLRPEVRRFQSDLDSRGHTPRAFAANRDS